MECRPDPDTRSLADLDPGKAPSFSVYGKANEALPSLEHFLVPLEGGGG